MANREAPTNRRRRAARAARGYTLIEVIVSTGIVSLLVLAAATASKVALVATATVTAYESQGSKGSHVASVLEQELLSASTASLQGVPSANGVNAETMQTNVNYKDVRFRKVTGFLNGAAVYDPPVNANALRVARNVDVKGRGSLVLIEGNQTTTLLDDVRSATFTRSGDKLVVSLVFGDSERGATTTSTLRYFLKVP